MRKPLTLPLILVTLMLVFGFPANAQPTGELSDADMALGYYEPLAQEGSPYAQLAIGEIYFDGNGVPRDLIKAYAWLTVAVMQGADEAGPVRDEAWAGLTAAQQGQAQALSGEYIQAYGP